MSGNVKRFDQKGYESLNRGMLQDVDNLSLQAIGLLCNLSSMPDSWTVYKTELYKRYGKNGRTSVQNAWNELVDNNYIVQFRKRNGRKYDYYYYFSQEKFTAENIKSLEIELGCSVWSGKVQKRIKKKKCDSETISSTAQNQQSKEEEEITESSTVDFEQSKMDSPKPTDIKLITNEVYHQDKDLDTVDTKDTVNDFFQKSFSFHFLTEENKKEVREKYMNKAFFENEEKVPKEITHMLQAFSDSSEQAKKYYDIILLAKNKVEEDVNRVIWLDNDHELIATIINTFSRAIRKIIKDRNIANPSGYIYGSVYQALSEQMRMRYQDYVLRDDYDCN